MIKVYTDDKAKLRKAIVESGQRLSAVELLDTETSPLEQIQQQLARELIAGELKASARRRQRAFERALVKREPETEHEL